MADNTPIERTTELVRLRKIRGVIARRASHTYTGGQHNVHVRDIRRSPENEGLNDAQGDAVKPGLWGTYEPTAGGDGVLSISDAIWA